MYALVKGTSAGLCAGSMFLDLGMCISEHSKIGQAVMEVRTDESSGPGVAVRRGAGLIRLVTSPTLQVSQGRTTQQSQNHEHLQ